MILVGASPALAATQPGGTGLSGTSSVKSAPTTAGLRLGARGTQVSLLQQDLTAAGYPTAVTGVYSTGTLRHVVAFQRRYSMAPNGVVGRSMFSKMHEVAVAEAILRMPSAATASSGAISATGMTGTAPGPGSTTATTTTTPTTTTPTTTTPTTTTPVSNSGGIALGPGPNSAPPQPGLLESDGLAMPPGGAPQTIRQVIAGGDMIAFDPYIYGGGHKSFNSAGYDCSGSVSFALHEAHLLSSPLDSSQFESWGRPGPGRWITLWANGGHVYMEVAGLFFDTAAQTSANGNDRWSLVRISPQRGFVERHPVGW
jgi:peptidoglycan hydrolase-like protein with peptidoglycan-binding domain